jgi:hypothetical protein
MAVLIKARADKTPADFNFRHQGVAKVHASSEDQSQEVRGKLGSSNTAGL